MREGLIYSGQLYLLFTLFLVFIVLQKGLKDNFADVQVSVVNCPDLTKEPFTFPVKGKQFCF